jgi:hypothetical protein
LGRVALATTVPQRDVDNHTGDGYRRRECRYGEKQAVVGQYLDAGLTGHACAVG